MKKRFFLYKIYQGDKDLFIGDTQTNIKMTIGYDDVDHKAVRKFAKEVVKKLNTKSHD